MAPVEVAHKYTVFKQAGSVLSCVLPLPAASEAGVVTDAEGMSAVSDGTVHVLRVIVSFCHNHHADTFSWCV